MIDRNLYREMHEKAGERFKANPSKCYQRHTREVWSEREYTTRLESFEGAEIERIPPEEAASFIRKYEWKKSMPQFLKASYALRVRGELLGVTCFATMGGPIPNICGLDLVPKTICLARGACAPHAPENAASYQTRWACEKAFEDFGWCVFYAYSDSEASEIGTIYDAVGWDYIGQGPGRPEGSFHVDFESPDGPRTLTSNALNHDKDKRIFRAEGWNESKGDPRQYLLHLGWKQKNQPGKGRWVWFEGTPDEKEYLRSRCRYPFIEKPKRVPALPMASAPDLGISKREAKRRAWKAAHPEDSGKSNREIDTIIHRAIRAGANDRTGRAPTVLESQDESDMEIADDDVAGAETLAERRSGAAGSVSEGG
jgi:hypothetical protein